MPSIITESLIEYGMAGLFIAYMVWQHVVNTKRSDGHLDQFFSNLERLRRENQEEVNDLRARYEMVIKNYRDERDIHILEREEMRKAISDIIDKNSSVLKQTTASLDTLSDNFRNLINSIQCLVKANEDTQTVMKDMKSDIRDLIAEKKLIEVAKAAAKSAIRKSAPEDA